MCRETTRLHLGRLGFADVAKLSRYRYSGDPLSCRMSRWKMRLPLGWTVTSSPGHRKNRNRRSLDPFCSEPPLSRIAVAGSHRTSDKTSFQQFLGSVLEQLKGDRTVWRTKTFRYFVHSIASDIFVNRYSKGKSDLAGIVGCDDLGQNFFGYIVL